MISRQDIQRLLHRPRGEAPILSLFLDMSVDSNNKRNHELFLSQSRRQFSELDSDRAGHHREALGEVFERVEGWLADRFEPENQGVAIYADVGGEWLEGLQFPVPVANRLEISTFPVIGPLSQIMDRYHHHGVLVIDRSTLRMMSVFLGRSRISHEVRGEPYPTSHDVQAGGYSAKSRQQRKAEEVRHFYKEFAREVAEFDRRYRPDDLIILGIPDNITRFLEALPERLRGKVVHTDQAPIGLSDAQILERLTPFFEARRRREATSAVQLLRERVAQNHFATYGFQTTLEQLQEGKVDTLVLARDAQRTGAHCTQCGFYVIGHDAGCTYCGGELTAGIDVVEAMIRMAEEQEVGIRYVEPQALADLNNVGALLKY